MAKRRIASSDDEYSDNDSISSVQEGPTTRPVAKKSKTSPTDTASSANLKPANRHALSIHVLSNAQPLSAALLQWYAGVHEVRGMPWRKQYNPSFGPEERAQRAYEVWISEIMLQQTQVATVIPYYNRWMEKFPTIRDLAASDIETVNGLWKGLGYYSRAARLLSGAQKCVKQQKGLLPDNAKDLQVNIPGIGRYSAGAICSIAYNHCVPVLDGNVNRLLSRVLALYASPKAKPTLDTLWAAATALVEATSSPGDLNQALIELGSTVCKVQNPECGKCPLRTWCKAYTNSREKQASFFTKPKEVADIEDMCILCEPLSKGCAVTSYPMKAEKKKPREELDVVNVVEWCSSTGDRYFLLVRRPDTGLLAGLHEFPTIPTDASPDSTRGSRNASAFATLSTSVMHQSAHASLTSILLSPPAPYDANMKRPLSDPAITDIRFGGSVLHVFSHIRKTYHLQWVLLEGGGTQPPALCVSSDVVSDNSKAKSGKGKVKVVKKPRKVEDEEDSGNEREETKVIGGRWVGLNEVEKANIGTGVVKVWKAASKLW